MWQITGRTLNTQLKKKYVAHTFVLKQNTYKQLCIFTYENVHVVAVRSVAHRQK